MAGPWDDKLASSFDDDEIRTAVDAFLRENVQPYVTQLEQKTNGLEDAQALYNDLMEKPGETYVAITREMFGDDAADKVIAALEAGEDPAAAAAQAADEATSTTDPSILEQLPAEYREAIEWASQTKRTNDYETGIEALKERHKEDPDFVDVDEKLLSPFVAITGGDMEAAYAGYKQYYQQFQEAVNPGPNVESLEELAGAPPTIGSTTGGATGATPTQKTYTSLDDAVDDFLAEMHSPPPTLGQV